MKNRTIIGIVCMILAVATTFAIAPVVNRLTSDTTTVVQLKQEVGRGTKITEDQVETVKVKTDTMPQGVYVKTADVVGKYASSTLYAGDILTKAKLSGDSNKAEPEKNKILTQKTKIGLDGRKHRRNLNVLVCGGSGAGKTRFYAKPNIMQANTSFVILDPKGENVRDTGGLLKARGYNIKVLDLMIGHRILTYNVSSIFQYGVNFARTVDLLTVIEDLFNYRCKLSFLFFKLFVFFFIA